MKTMQPCFAHRSCYINFAEHLQNSWNPNMYFKGAPNIWSPADWKSFLIMIKHFGFNCFEYWLAPTMYDKPALKGNGIYGEFAENIRQITATAHSLGIKTKVICGPTCMGPAWYHFCPKVPGEKAAILALWKHWAKTLAGADIVAIFPGDPGGCNRNGCNHETFVDLALEISGVVKKESPSSVIEIGTWGTPFSGWGADMWFAGDKDGSWKNLTDKKHGAPDQPCYIWNGKPPRARQAINYLLRRLPEFPTDTMVAINLGFSPDGDATHGGDAREYARAIARLRPITSWDYSVSEGELVCYPHWRLPRMAARRREERSAAPYSGGVCYTMTPRLNLMTLFAAGRFFQNPDDDPDRISKEFCANVFGAEHAQLGELFEAFEVVKAWGHYPRRKWDKEVLAEKYQEITDRLESANVSSCSLPLFPDPETYRQDLLWFAQRFLEMAGPNPDRERIRKNYWAKALAIYDVIPMSADRRAESSARQFSRILA